MLGALCACLLSCFLVVLCPIFLELRSVSADISVASVLHLLIASFCDFLVASYAFLSFGAGLNQFCMLSLHKIQYFFVTFHVFGVSATPAASQGSIKVGEWSLIHVLV